MRQIPDIQRSLPRNIEELRGRNDPEAVKAVAKEMEAMFAYELIKVMRETTGVSSKGTLGGDAYLSMFDMEISKLFAERGLGLQDMLVKGLNKVAEKNRKQAPGEELKALVPGNDHAKISSGYGLRRDPFSGKLKFHYGLDLPAPEGAEVHAVRKGTVVFSGEQQGYGNVVILDHGDGFLSKYAHNQANLVRQGQEVDTGSIIAQVGSTGKSTGPHVHFEVFYKGEHVDPNTLLVQEKIKDFQASADKKTAKLIVS